MKGCEESRQNFCRGDRALSTWAIEVVIQLNGANLHFSARSGVFLRWPCNLGTTLAHILSEVGLDRLTFTFPLYRADAGKAGIVQLALHVCVT